MLPHLWRSMLPQACAQCQRSALERQAQVSTLRQLLQFACSRDLLADAFPEGRAIVQQTRQIRVL